MTMLLAWQHANELKNNYNYQFKSINDHYKKPCQIHVNAC